MRYVYTYGSIRQLNKIADEIIDSNPGVIFRKDEFDIHSNPYLVSKIDIKNLIIPEGWEIRNNSIINPYNLFRIDIIYDDA